jgi:sugar transferase (PEP-CTERM system associated)
MNIHQPISAVPTPPRITLPTTSGFVMLVLLLLDLFGTISIFLGNHWFYAGPFTQDLYLIWKLVLIVSFSFLYNYLMDLYTYESTLSQLGMLERSFIAMLLTGATVALTVYLTGPNTVGGFVGRGVLASSLLMVWLYGLGIRYLLNPWFLSKRRQVVWLVLTHGDDGAFVEHFRSAFGVEKLAFLGPPSTPGNSQIDTIDAAPLTYAGDWSTLEAMLATEPVAGVIVVAPEKMPEQLIDRLMSIRIQGMRLFTLNDFYEKHLNRLPVKHLNQQWLAMAHGFELIHNPIGLRFKRYVDILIALIGGLVLLPVMLLVAVLVLVTSGWPIFYRQVRTGEHGQPFNVVKFRTMVIDAEKDGAQYAARSDPRVTPLGSWLRRLRLDELPQLWNVLKGEMSLIGPRPERPEFIATLQLEIPYYNLRHLVKPGITGWAQVMYGYGDKTQDSIEKLQFDLYYIKNYSLLLDISIMVRTVKVILFGAGR